MIFNRTTLKDAHIIDVEKREDNRGFFARAWCAQELHDAGLDNNLEQAAMDLYATESQTFWRVTFPLVFPGILSAALLSFSLSFDDFIITNLNAGQEVTFPMFVWGAAQRGIPPQINVIGTIMFLLALVLVVLGELNSRRRQAAASR